MTINLPQQSSRGVNRTAIEWADYAVGSPFRFRDRETGELLANACVKLSSGCAHCYAEAIGQRFKTGRPYTKAEMDRLEPLLDEGVIRHILTFRPSPAKGAATYKNGRDRPVLFLGDMTDIFGEWVPDHLIDPVMAAVALRPDVDVIVLTKRARSMAGYMNGLRPLTINDDPPMMLDVRQWISAEIADMTGAHGWLIDKRDASGNITSRASWPLPNLWLGVSVEDQATADERIPHLLATPAAVRVVSAEPLLGPVDLTRIGLGNGDTGDCLNHTATDIWRGAGDQPRNWGRVHHVIVGGESGPGARPSNVEWIRSLVRQGKEAGVTTLVKQLGSRPYTCKCGAAYTGYHAPMCLPLDIDHHKGGDPSEWPDDLCVRQMLGGVA